jgi:CBS domain-containing protein
VGIFTERDVLWRVVPRAVDLDATPVSEVMTRDPETLPADCQMAQALRTMALGGYRHIPLVDDSGRPTGLVSMRQIVESLVELFPDEILNAPPETQHPPTTAEGA